MKIRLLADCIGSDIHARAGQVVDLEDGRAEIMISTGHAEAVPDEEPVGAPPAGRRRRATKGPAETR